MIIYDLGNIADWVSAIGTIGAVVVALYLANKQLKPKIRISSKYSYIVDNLNGMSKNPFELNIEIVNQGFVPIYLTECSLMVDKEKLVFSGNKHIANKMLNPGELYVHPLEYEPILNFITGKKKKRLKVFVFCKDGSGCIYKSKIKLHI